MIYLISRYEIGVPWVRERPYPPHQASGLRDEPEGEKTGTENAGQ